MNEAKRNEEAILTELLCCPFCGNNDLEVCTSAIPHGPNLVQVCCNTCLTYGPVDDTEIGAKIEWNKRAIYPVQ